MKHIVFASQLFEPLQPSLRNTPLPPRAAPRREERAELPLREERAEPPAELRGQREQELLDELKAFMKSSEHMYSTQKSDLVNLITELLQEKHTHLRAHLDQIVETKLDKLKGANGGQMDVLLRLFESRQQQQPLPQALPQAQPLPQALPLPLPAPAEPKAERKRGGKYLPLPQHLWGEIRTRYPDLDDELRDKAFIRDGTYFVKLKNNFIRVDETGVAKIINYLRHH